MSRALCGRTLRQNPDTFTPRVARARLRWRPASILLQGLALEPDCPSRVWHADTRSHVWHGAPAPEVRCLPSCLASLLLGAMFTLASAQVCGSRQGRVRSKGVCSFRCGANGCNDTARPTTGHRHRATHHVPVMCTETSPFSPAVVPCADTEVCEALRGMHCGVWRGQRFTHVPPAAPRCPSLQGYQTRS